MKEFSLGEIFEHGNRTLMCVENPSVLCNGCYLYDTENCNDDNSYCNPEERKDHRDIIYTKKLIFESTDLIIQIKRNGCKVKVKVLEEATHFGSLESDKFKIKSNPQLGGIFENTLVISTNEKYKKNFETEQEAITWVHGLFSLRVK